MQPVDCMNYSFSTASVAVLHTVVSLITQLQRWETCLNGVQVVHYTVVEVEHEVAVNQLTIKQQQLVQMLYFIFSQQVLTETLQCHCIKYVFISLYCLLYICGSLFTCHADTWIQVSIGGLCLFVTQIKMERNPYPQNIRG